MALLQIHSHFGQFSLCQACTICRAHSAVQFFHIEDTSRISSETKFYLSNMPFDGALSLAL